MEEALAGIAARPSLAAWLLGDGWKRGFDRGSLSRGISYANEKTITDIELIDLPGTGELIATASVQGTRRKPYLTSLVFRESRGVWHLETECTCPVGVDCKHATAVAYLLQKKLARAILSAPDPRRPQEALEMPVASWLQEIEAASRKLDPPAAGKPKQGGIDRFLAYCVEVPASRSPQTLQLALRVGNRLKDGTIRIQSGLATADPSKPPQYMAKEDVMLVTLYRQRLRKHSGWGTMPMEGSGWDELLEGILATGRAYFGDEPTGHRGSSDYKALVAGPPEKLEARWQSQPDGSALPVIAGGRPGILFLPTLPPRYLDQEGRTIGFIESNIPPSMLPAWSRGPAIRPQHVPEVIERLAKLGSLSLPTPVPVETETRPAVQPKPFLRIRKHVFSDWWQRIEVLIGELTFAYDDSPRLYPLTNNAPRQHVEMIGNKRVVWPRDFHAERSAERRLLSLPLLPAPSAIPANLLDRETRHAVIAARPFPSAELAWLELLDGPGFEELRQEGWTIETDESAGLTARIVSEFEPAIETDPDHGIDWFRFDVSYEIDGKRFSLIPVIADAIANGYPPADSPDLPEFISIRCENPEDGFIRFPAKRLMEIVDRVRHLFEGRPAGPLRMDRLAAAGVADALAIDSSDTTRALASLGRNLRDIHGLPEVALPATVNAALRPYQQEGFRWLQFLAAHGLHGILADDMGLGKTLQTLAHLAAEREKEPGRPSLVIAPTSVVPNWAAEAAKFVPGLKTITLHGPNRSADFARIPEADVIFTSYPLLSRDFETLSRQEWHVVALDEAQHIKNPKAATAQFACQLKGRHRLCLSGTPMENHLGELWSLMRFLMPGFLGEEKAFNTRLRRPIERERSRDAQLALNRRVSPLILRRTKDEVAKELPEKTEIIHGIDLNKKQADLYESVRASMDKRVREAIEAKGLAKSHIIVLDALLKLRQICCHPQLLKNEAARKVSDSAKLGYLTEELLPTLLEEGRRILIFSQFTSMLGLIEAHLEKEKIPYLKLTGQTKERAALVTKFQGGEIPVFLISLKAGGTGLNLTAADTVIHYDPWWNPAAENQATDRAHRIGQTKPVFVHKLVCRGTIEDRIHELQKHKAGLVKALLSEDTAKLKIDAETLSHLLGPLD